MKKVKRLFFMRIVTGIILISFAVLLFFLLIFPQMKINNILNNGTEVTANIIDIRLLPNYQSENDDGYYKIKFEYQNSCGVRIEGETTSNYKLSSLKALGYITTNSDGYSINQGKTIQVKYLADDVIEKNYIGSSTWLYWTVIIVCSAVGIGIIITSVIVKYRKNEKK